MSGNLEDKIKYSFRDYSGYATIESGERQGTKQIWIYNGRRYLLERGYPGYYYKKPHQIAAEFKTLVDRDFPYDRGGRLPPEPTPLENFEGTIYHNEEAYIEGKEAFKNMKTVDRVLDVKSEVGEKEMNSWNKAAGLDRSKIRTVARIPIVLVAIAIGVLGYFLFAGRKG
jgi:hypothetical protein